MEVRSVSDFTSDAPKKLALLRQKPKPCLSADVLKFREIHARLPQRLRLMARVAKVVLVRFSPTLFPSLHLPLTLLLVLLPEDQSITYKRSRIYRSIIELLSTEQSICYLCLGQPFSRHSEDLLKSCK